MREYREFESRQQRVRSVWLLTSGIVVLFILCVVTSLFAQRLFPPTSELMPEVTLTVTVAPATRTAVLAPIPTNTPTPTEPPSPTPADTATPTITPSPTPIPPSDPQGDVVSYASLALVDGFPAGVDIRAASVDADLGVVLQPTEGVPEELPVQAAGEVLLWIALYDPIPDPPTAYTEWLFVLDLDGDIETGRPAGSLRTNPDLGVEVAIGAYYNPAIGEYDVYSLVWDPERHVWVNGSVGLHFVLSESRMLVGLALPLETLTQSAAQITGVTVVPEAVRGRSAALADVAGQRIIDFYPERPGD